MEFVKNSANLVPLIDTVFALSEQAKQAKKQLGADKVVDATVGSLYSEDGELVALDTVFTSYDALPSQTKAAYASDVIGNSNYREQVKEWVLDGHNKNLIKSVIATPGGTGAISTCFETLLEPGQSIVLPEVAWGSYALMAQVKQVKAANYSMFNEQGFTLDHLKAICRDVMAKDGKVVMIVNDPCHNPTGYSMTNDQWKDLIDFVNELSKQGPVVLVNDIAYIDYAYSGKNARNYMDNFDFISNRVLIVLAFSISKSLTSYGLRLGAAVVLGKQEQDVRTVAIVMEKAARAFWSNVANAAMENFVLVTTTHKDSFEKERQKYVDLLKQRSDIFVREAKEANLPIYPYKEGFFVTIKVDNKLRDVYNDILLENQIYTVKVNQGIRVAICSLNVKQSYGLAARMKDLLDEAKKQVN